MPKNSLISKPEKHSLLLCATYTHTQVISDMNINAKVLNK